MAENVIVRQNRRFETHVLAADPEEVTASPQAVTHLHALTPYGMMLAGLGTCTALVVHTYAQHHGVALDDVEIRLEYRRKFREDCENCESIDRYTEQITEEIQFTGDLSDAEREKLFRIAHQCPIYKMYRSGIDVASILAPAP